MLTLPLLTPTFLTAHTLAYPRPAPAARSHAAFPAQLSHAPFPAEIHIHSWSIMESQRDQEGAWGRDLLYLTGPRRSPPFARVEVEEGGSAPTCCLPAIL